LFEANSGGGVPMEIVLIALVTLIAGAIGTLTGFGTSTVMVPVLVSFYPLTEALFLVGIVHWFGDIWKMLLFRSGVRWRLILLFGLTGVTATALGGLLAFRAPADALSRLLGAFLFGYVVFIFLKRRFEVPQSNAAALAGGALYGLSAGIFGVGGAIRGAFLAAYNLPKDVYIFTAGAIGLVVDSGRLATYWWQGAQLQSQLWWGFLLFVPASFAGAKIAEAVVERVPQERFRGVIAVFLGLVAIKLLLLP
jgi:uncharacterized membrane protein YfcA